MSGAPWVLRSLLFFPGNRPDMIAKAGRYGADALILDLEDGVAPDEKARARQVVAGALDAGVPGSPIVFLRVNGSGSGLLAWDLREAFRPGAAALCLPKCETPEAVLTLDASLQALESQHRLPRGGIRILPMIESARGVVQAAAIAPEAAEVEQARRIVAAFEAAEARGSGIVVVDGAMVDRPVVLRARRTLAIASRPAAGRERD